MSFGFLPAELGGSATPSGAAPWLLAGLGAIAAGGVGLLVWMAGGWQRPRIVPVRPEELAGVRPVRPVRPAGKLRVVTWNIAWGYGFGSEGSGRARPRDWFEGSLAKMGAVLAALEPDVVLLQEVDFDSTRSHGIDQAERLARAAGLPWIARAPSWTARWVPFPYWPPSEHFGRMSSGGVILSRFPIRTAEVELLEKPAKNAAWYNLFYLFRYLQRAELEVDGRTLRLVNVHLEAFDPSAREAQAEHLADWLGREGVRDTIVGGDLNTVPPEQTVRRAYPDEPHTNHERDRTLDVLRAVPGLEDAVPPDRFRTREESWFTFPAHAPNRKLDHVLVGPGLEPTAARVAHEAGDASDHLPLVVDLTLG